MAKTATSLHAVAGEVCAWYITASSLITADVFCLPSICWHEASPSAKRGALRCLFATCAAVCMGQNMIRWPHRASGLSIVLHMYMSNSRTGRFNYADPMQGFASCVARWNEK